jgi:indole-3-glycerol phosphate synthase
MSDILARIAAYKREDLRARRSAASLASLENRARSRTEPRGFRTALRNAYSPGRLPLIAEIKKASPSKGVIREDFEPAALARAYEQGGATCLSVLTDGPSFQGLDGDLVAARDASNLPCLRKEFLIDPWQVAESRALGADAVLVILALVDDSLATDLMSEAKRMGMDALIETHDRGEFHRASRLGGDLIGVNNRDLRTFVTDLTVTERLAEETPVNTLLVTESGIFSSDDAARMEAAGARAMLVGESLMRAHDVETATRALLGLRRDHLDNF